MASSLLRGMRVIDLTTPLAYRCGVFLASLGAEVIRVDREAGEAALDWRLGNIGKHCVAIDYETPAGRAVLADAIAGSDVVLESFKPGVMAALGLDYPTLSKANPGLTLVSITPFGQTGPHADWEADELVTAATSGVMQVHGWPDRAPVKEPLEAHFFHACLAGAMGAVVADRHRRRTGLGQWVDVSAQELGASRNVTAALAYQFDGRVPQRWGDHLFLDLARGPHRRIWALKDGYAAAGIPAPTPVAGGKPSASDALAQWMDDLGFGEPAPEASLDAGAAWIKRAEDFLKERTKAELNGEGLRRGVNLTVVNTPADVPADPHFASRGFLATVHGLGERPIKIPRWVIRVEGDEIGAPRVPSTSGAEALTTCGRPASAPAASKSDEESILPLAGVKILDFSWAVVGNTATKILADLGATVVKVESRKRLAMERLGFPVQNMKRDGGPDNSPWFANIATSKLSLRLDVTHPEAQGVLDELLQWTDIVYENFSPGVMDRLGLGYEALRAKRPDLIMVSGSIFGQTGLFSRLSGTDSSGAAHCGRLSMSGDPDRGLTLPSATYGDSILPFAIVTAMIAAVRRRDETGQGCRLDASMAEMLTHQMAPAIVEAQREGRSTPRTGNRSPERAPRNVFPTRGEDEWIAISVAGDERWRALCTALGAPALGAESRFATLASRKANEDALEAEIGRLTGALDRFELAAKLQVAGVAAGPLQSAADIMDRDPQMAARGFFQSVEHPVVGAFAHQRTPLSFSLTPPRMLAAPLLGEHTEQVCLDFLGMDRARYLALVDAGVFN